MSPADGTMVFLSDTLETSEHSIAREIEGNQADSFRPRLPELRR